MTAKLEEGEPGPKVCPIRLWCCGNLRTATISVGFTNIISLMLLTSYYLGTTMYSESFHLTMLVVVLIVMFLIFINTGLIYGATKRYQWLFIPWMLIYLPAILALLIFCSIQFGVLEGRQLSAILLVMISSYFYAIVVASYIELKLQNKILKENEDDCAPDGATSKMLNKSTKNDSTKKNRDDVLIDLTELDNLNSTNCDDSIKIPTGDETFSALALRTPSTNAVENGRILGTTAYSNLDDSGEFTMPHVDDVTGTTDFNFSSHFNGTGNGLLPVPEEVIAIEKMVQKIDAESGKLQTTTSATALTATTEDLLNEIVSKRLDMSRNTKSLLSVETDQLIGLLPSKSEAKIPRSLVVNVDANFSPFRKADVRNGADALPIPKMKIFLPKNCDTSDDGSSDTSSEEETNSPLKET